MSTQPEQRNASEHLEPVAWRVRWPKMGGGYAWVMNDAPLMAEHGFINEPLYTTPPQRKPLTDEQIEKLREKTFSTNNPFCPVDSKSMRKAVRAAEAAHNIKE